MRVLITGGAGFLGDHLARRLAGLGQTVVTYDPAPPPARADPAARVTAVLGSVTDEGALVDTLRRHGIDQVVHLATLLTEACAANPVRGTLVNCGGTAAVFDAAAAAGVRRVVFGSSVAALGAADPGAPGDAAPVRPTSVYGASKAYAELLAGALRVERPAQELVGLRFGWIYGPGRLRGWNALQDVVVGFALEHDEVPYPDYARPSDWTYVDDAVDAIVLALRAPRPPLVAYNVPGDYRTVHEAVGWLHARFPRVRPRPYAAALPPVAWDFRLDRAPTDLGYRPRITLEAGLERAVRTIRRAHGLAPAPAGPS